MVGKRHFEKFELQFVVDHEDDWTQTCRNPLKLGRRRYL